MKQIRLTKIAPFNCLKWQVVWPFTLNSIMATIIFAELPAQAQGPSQAEINNWLNQIDSPSNWQQVPKVEGVPNYSTGNPLPSKGLTPTTGPGPSQNWGSFLQKQARNLNQASTSKPMHRKEPTATNLRPTQMPFKLTRQDILRIFFGGGNTSSYGNQQAVYGTRDKLQLAKDEAAQAESAASRAEYESEQYTRQSAAAEAQNHANAARAAADQAAAEAAQGTQEAKDAAEAAQAEASRAQAAADRAHASAAGALW